TNWPGENKDIQPVDCTLAATTFPLWGTSMYLTHYAASGTREQETAENFMTFHAGAIEPKTHSIMIYHFMHIIKGFQACMPFLPANGDGSLWHSKWTKSSWFSKVLSAAPSLE